VCELKKKKKGTSQSTALTWKKEPSPSISSPVKIWVNNKEEK
jgi:hypothetical protein